MILPNQVNGVKFNFVYILFKKLDFCYSNKLDGWKLHKESLFLYEMRQKNASNDEKIIGNITFRKPLRYVPRRFFNGRIFFGHILTSK